MPQLAPLIYFSLGGQFEADGKGSICPIIPVMYQIKHIRDLKFKIKNILLGFKSLVTKYTSNYYVGEKTELKPKISRKYSDLMKWDEQMLKDVGLNVPPKSTNNNKNISSHDVDVIFIKKSKKS
jgi:hypothetical protein